MQEVKIKNTDLKVFVDGVPSIQEMSKQDYNLLVHDFEDKIAKFYSKKSKTKKAQPRPP